METLDKGLIHVPGRTQGDGERSHHVTPNGTQFKTYALLISGISHLLSSDHDRPQVTEITES